MTQDSRDKAILEALQVNGRMSNVELAERVGLSESPCYRRVRALEESGVIASYRATLDRGKLGLQVTAFVLVTVENQDDRMLGAFIEAVEAEACIVECHAMSGSHDFLLKTVTRSMEHFSELAMQHILKLPGVKNIESNFSLRVVKENGPLPIF
jgi:Lrp/AsnC family leucine-responsive transcriptional regulator